MKKQKKGFTLLELIIVIAVFAILIAILIPTFIGIIRRAKLTVDQATVKNLNTMAYDNEKSWGRAKTIREAIAVAKANGYDIEALTPTADGAYILWDSVNDRWILFDVQESTYLYYDKNCVLPEKVYMWNVNTEYIEEDGFSVYLKDGYTGDEDLEITTGLDVGNNTNIKSVNYERQSTESSQDVIIYTNGGMLKINAIQDTVEHYGSASVLLIDAVKNSSYHEFGNVESAQIKTGRIVIENEQASINNLLLIAKADKSKFEEIIVETKTGAEFPVFDRTDVNISANGTLVVNVVTPSTNDYIYLTKAGVIEQVVVTNEYVNTESENVAEVSSAKSASDTSESTYTASEQVANVGTKNEQGKYVDKNNNVVELEDLTSTTQIVVEKKAEDKFVLLGLTLFSGGVGTEDSPFLVSNLTDLTHVGANANNLMDTNIGWLGGYTYALVSDLVVNDNNIRGHKAETMGSGKHSDIAVYMDDGTVFYGNNHTITVNTNDLFIFHGPEGNSSKTAVLKDLNVVLNGTNLGVCAYAKKCVIENITISGDVVWTGDNMGILVATIYDNTSNAQVTTLKNITNNCNIRVEGGSTRYDGLFVGSIQQTKTGNNAPTIEFINCVNNANVVGQRISMFVGNPFGYGDLKIVTQNVINNGTIKAMNTEYYANLYYSNPSNLGDSNKNLYINGSSYKCANVPSFNNIYTDTNIINLGLITQAQEDENLSITVNADKSITVTPSENASITKYVVYLGLYTTGYNEDGTTNGSGRFYVSEEINVAEIGNGVALKNYGFVDQTWVDANQNAEAGTLAGNDIYTLDDNVYYMIENSYYENHAGFGFGGNVRYATMISVVAYDVNNNIVCTALAR